jgi:hypothetical protein
VSVIRTMILDASLARQRRLGRQRGPRRSWLFQTAPELVAVAVPAVGKAVWQTERVAFTSTLVAIAVVSCDVTQRRAIVKMPCTPEGVETLRRQDDVLAALHADPRSTHWRRLVPRNLGRGEVQGYPYWVEEALPGTPVTAAMLRRRRDGCVLDAAVRLIDELRVSTSERKVLDEGTAQEWVERPLRRVEESDAVRTSRFVAAIGCLRTELTSALVGRTVNTSWIHGDFWPGNLLIRGRRVTGIVDWDRASPHELQLHDLLHAYAFSRRLVTGQELGEVVVEAMQRGIADAIGIPADRVACWLDGIPERSAVLLYWLRYISFFIDSEGHRDNPRWIRGNVDRVLANI